MCETVVIHVAFVGAAGAEGGWLSLAITTATCWTMAGISSVISKCVSMLQGCAHSGRHQPSLRPPIKTHLQYKTNKNTYTYTRTNEIYKINI